METINYNDTIRKMILKRLKNSKNDEKIEEFYDEISRDENVFKEVINIMYLTSYIVNLYTLNIYNDDKDTINNVKFLKSFNDISEFVLSVDLDTFKNLCYDTILFIDSEYYIRKKYIVSLLDRKEEILKKFPLFLNDICNYGMQYSKEYIIDEYNEILNQVKDKKIAMEDSICFITEFLIKLEEDDFDNYRSLIISMAEDYYMYNKSLNEAKLEADSYAPEIMELLEDRVEDFVRFSANNSELLEPLIRDFLKYNLFSPKVKEIIKDSYSKERAYIKKRDVKIFNPNDIVRQYLFDTFDFNVIASLNIPESYDRIVDDIVKSDDFDFILSVLYTDFYSLSYYDYMTYPKTNDEIDFIKSFNSIEELKTCLLSDREKLYEFICQSMCYYIFGYTDKYNMINLLNSNDLYKGFITKNYLFDMASIVRDYDLEDAVDLYYEAYEEEQDEKIAVSTATCYLQKELIELSIINYDNYKDFCSQILNIFYMYVKYLVDKGYDVSKDELQVMNLIENDYDKFFSDFCDTNLMVMVVLDTFYKYLTCGKLEKKSINDYYQKLKNSGKLKKLDKKNKNSN